MNFGGFISRATYVTINTLRGISREFQVNSGRKDFVTAFYLVFDLFYVVLVTTISLLFPDYALQFVPQLCSIPNKLYNFFILFQDKMNISI